MINSSTSKSNFAFSKDIRFKPLKLSNHMTAYTPRISDFEKAGKHSGRGNGFGASQMRFDYYSSRSKQGTEPSAADFNSVDKLTQKGGSFHRTNKIS